MLGKKWDPFCISFLSILSSNDDGGEEEEALFSLLWMEVDRGLPATPS